MKSLTPPLFYQYPAHLDLWTSDGVNRALKHLNHPSVKPSVQVNEQAHLFCLLTREKHVLHLFPPMIIVWEGLIPDWKGPITEWEGLTPVWEGLMTSPVGS